MQQDRPYFYPRPPRGGRHLPRWVQQPAGEFLSTPSARRATCPLKPWRLFRSISIHALREEGDSACFCSIPSFRNFYPRPPRGGRQLSSIVKLPPHIISIHALREEGDDFPVDCHGSRDISIHALREEGDQKAMATAYCQNDFYPRPPRGGRLRPFDDLQDLRDISIHALREEGDSGAP